MNYSEAAIIRSNYVSWLNVYNWDVALSLNFKPNISAPAAKHAARHFFNLLDCLSFGRRQLKKGQRLKRACFLEGDDIRNRHYHCIMELPSRHLSYEMEHMTASCPNQFGIFAVDLWRSLDQSGKFNAHRPVYDQSGWINYITKECFSSDECFDADASHL